MAGSCPHSNEPRGSIKYWEILERLSDWWLLKKDSQLHGVSCVKFYIFTAVTTKSINFWIVAPCSLVEFTDVLEERIASISGPKSKPAKRAKYSETSVKMYQITWCCIPEDSGHGLGAFLCYLHNRLSFLEHLLDLKWPIFYGFHEIWN
jgi:hypothetical protein